MEEGILSGGGSWLEERGDVGEGQYSRAGRRYGLHLACKHCIMEEERKEESGEHSLNGGRRLHFGKMEEIWR